MRLRFVLCAALALAASTICQPEAGEAAGPESGRAPAPEPPSIVWEPWSEELFARARQEDRGVLLTIVSQACRACATADAEVWSDPVVRKGVARRWIPVRIHRNDRPDLDARYQFAAAALTRGRSGYPLTAFLFPTGEAMWADTYIPAEDREGRPGMRNLLVSMDAFWRTRFEEAQRNAMSIQKQFDTEARQRREPAPAAQALPILLDGIIGTADARNGGYGEVPRATNPLAATAVLLASLRRADPGLREQALRALRAPVDGALHDRIGGGFHQATRDEAWTVPQFEKTLAANAVWLRALLEALKTGEAEDLRPAATKTVDYILGSLAAPGGGYFFGQAPSADPNDEAAYYTWTVDEVKSLLSPSDLPWARLLFGWRDEGEVLLGLPPRLTLKNTMTAARAAAEANAARSSVEAASSRIVSRLAEARSRRPSPPVLEAVYADGSALAASALLDAGLVLDRTDAVASALRTLERLLAAAPDPAAGVPHRIDAPAGSPRLMPDLAHLGNALFDAWEATGESRWLEAARRCGAGLRELYGDPAGGFFDVVAQPEAAGYARIRRKTLPDGATPSPQAAAAMLLRRLAMASGEPASKAADGLAALAWTVARVSALDGRLSATALAMDGFAAPEVKVTLGTGAGAGRLAAAAFRLAAPGRVILRTASPGSARASVCVGEACREGIEDEAALAAAYRDLSR